LLRSSGSKIRPSKSRSSGNSRATLVIPTGAQRSGGICSCCGVAASKSVHPNRDFPVIVALPLSSRPERTRISYFAMPATATYAALLRESCTGSINATVLDRKSGERSGGIWSCCGVAAPKSIHQAANLSAVSFPGIDSGEVLYSEIRSDWPERRRVLGKKPASNPIAGSHAQIL
jgi:hypothetical protein